MKQDCLHFVSEHMTVTSMLYLKCDHFQFTVQCINSFSGRGGVPCEETLQESPYVNILLKIPTWHHLWSYKKVSGISINIGPYLHVYPKVALSIWKENKNAFQSKAYHLHNTYITKTFTIDRKLIFFYLNLIFWDLWPWFSNDLSLLGQS